jgi:integrase
VARGRRTDRDRSSNAVSERLGHAKISITSDTYSHVIPAMETDAADRIAALIPRLRRSG